MQDRLITISELSELLGGFGPATLYRHMQNIPDFPKKLKVGDATRFRLSDVETYIENLGKPKNLPDVDTSDLTI